MKGLHNVTLKGQGQFVQDFHCSVMQSNVFIRCASKDTIGINISHTNSVHIDSLTISKCLTGVSFTSVFHKSFYRTSVQNCSNFGIDIFRQTFDEADVLVMKESPISYSGDGIRARTFSAMSSYKLTSINSSSTHVHILLSRTVLFTLREACPSIHIVVFTFFIQ